uniref:Uncharacterized protein n=1 Tax=Tanacetum cinerariifolium TaxID=118510 RepID=A0A699KSQ5_TANCI|nr:hypothetical protein [Tanacetum cinerariifolium]
MVFMVKMEKVLSDSEESSSSDKDTIVEVSYYFSDSDSGSEFDDTSDYYDNSELNYGLFVDNDDDQEILHDAIELAKESSSSDKDTIVEVSYYFSDSDSGSEFDDTSDYYDNSELNYGLFVDNDDDQEILHDAIELASENFDENLVVS